MTIKSASRSLGTIADRSTKYGVVYKVKLKGAKSRKITFTVTADGGYKATKSFKFEVPDRVLVITLLPPRR